MAFGLSKVELLVIDVMFNREVQLIKGRQNVGGKMYQKKNKGAPRGVSLTRRGGAPRGGVVWRSVGSHDLLR